MELGVASAVEILAEDKLIPRLAEVDDGVENGAGAGRHGQGRRPALKRRDPLLQHILRRVHQPGINIPQLLQAEKIGRMLGILEDIRAGSVNRHRPRQSGGIRLLSRMKSQ